MVPGLFRGRCVKDAPQLSVVVPVFNEQDNVAPLVAEIVAALRGLVRHAVDRGA